MNTIFGLVSAHVTDYHDIRNLRLVSHSCRQLVDNNINNRIKMYTDIGHCIKNNDIDAFTLLLAEHGDNQMTQIKRTKKNKRIMHQCIQYNNSVCLDIFIETFPDFLKRIICNAAAEVGNVHILDHMMTKYRCKWSAKNLITASINGHIDILKYGLCVNLHLKWESMRKIPNITYYNALKYKHFDCFDFLTYMGPRTPKTGPSYDDIEFSKLLAETKDLRYFKALHTFDFPIKKELYKYAIQYNNADLIRHMITVKIPCGDIIYREVHKMAYKKMGTVADSELYAKLSIKCATTFEEVTETYEYIYAHISDILASFF